MQNFVCRTLNTAIAILITTCSVASGASVEVSRVVDFEKSNKFSGIISLSNGGFVGFKGSTLYFLNNTGALSSVQLAEKDEVSGFLAVNDKTLALVMKGRRRLCFYDVPTAKI